MELLHELPLLQKLGVGQALEEALAQVEAVIDTVALAHMLALVL